MKEILSSNAEITQMRFVLIRDFTQTSTTFSLSAEGRIDTDEDFKSLTYPSLFMPLVPAITFDCQPAIAIDPILFDTQCLDEMDRLAALLQEKLDAVEVLNTRYEVVLLNKNETATRCFLNGRVIVDSEPMRRNGIFAQQAANDSVLGS